MLSPYNDLDFSKTTINMFNSHHKTITNSITATATVEKEASLLQSSYIINCIGTFIYRALEKRKKYMKDVQDREVHLNTITINFSNN